MSAISNQSRYITCNTKEGCENKATHRIEVLIDGLTEKIFSCKACFRGIHNAGINVLSNHVLTYSRDGSPVKFRSQSK